MATIQTTILEDHAAGQPGLVANTTTRDVDSRRVEGSTARIAFGVAVSQGTEYDQIVQGATDGSIAGISVLDKTLRPSQEDNYVEGDVASVLWRGDIWVEVSDQGTGDSVSIGDSVRADSDSGAITAVDSGRVRAVTIGNGGAGYMAATTTVSIAAPGGSGVRATGTPVIVNGVLTAITITNSGSGYTAVPSVTVSDSNSGTPTTAASGLVAVLTETVPVPGAKFMRDAESGDLTIVRLSGE